MLDTCRLCLSHLFDRDLVLADVQTVHVQGDGAGGLSASGVDGAGAAEVELGGVVAVDVGLQTDRVVAGFELGWQSVM